MFPKKTPLIVSTPRPSAVNAIGFELTNLARHLVRRSPFPQCRSALREKLSRTFRLRQIDGHAGDDGIKSEYAASGNMLAAASRCRCYWHVKSHELLGTAPLRRETVWTFAPQTQFFSHTKAFKGVKPV